METGIDLVNVDRMKSIIEDEEKMNKIFNPSEMSDDPERLAGIFAAKEAFFKAKGMDEWLKAEVLKDEEGKPSIRYEGKDYKASISHEDKYAIAMVVILEYNK
ncbi:MAG: holo-ACP synthase [Nanobdellota archaeon]